VLRNLLGSPEAFVQISLDIRNDLASARDPQRINMGSGATAPLFFEVALPHFRVKFVTVC
jgi:hypothetical protein